MKITDIKQQTKRPERYSIYVDGKYQFSLTETQLITSGVRIDQQVSSSELENFKEESQLGKAYERCLRYITIRPRSQFEIEQYMKKKEYSDQIIANTLQKLQKNKLTNDLDFAKAWVEWRINIQGRSKLHVRSELIKKKVSKDIVDEVLEGVSKNTELQNVRNLIERKSKLSQYQDRQKLIAFLARRGYSYELIKKALKS